MDNRRTLVIALGGNAISPQGEIDTIENQFRHTSDTAIRIAHLIEEGWQRLVIAHGNGPQVGNVVRRVELARDIAPWLPLDICVADTQGGMGYMIQQCLRNALRSRGIDREVATVVTQVVVDRDDPGFRSPSKPIGPTKRLVASPVPHEVIEAKVISTLVDSNVIVIAGGGGGVPVVSEQGVLSGVEGVVDKDLTASLIATSIGAARLVILTDVDAIYTHFGEVDQARVETATVAEMRAYATSGAFTRGTMGPKVEAACRFVESGGEVAVIAHLDQIEEAVHSKAGTRITR
ncbi:MAG: carbamate kinase [Actinomycetota bacterium]